MNGSPIDIARAAWDTDLPYWIARLAEECAASSQNRVASRLGRSAALVSHVLRRKYPGDMAAVEALVRDVLMPVSVNCPVLGEIATSTCRDWMVRAGNHAGDITRGLDLGEINARVATGADLYLPTDADGAARGAAGGAA